MSELSPVPARVSEIESRIASIEARFGPNPATNGQAFASQLNNQLQLIDYNGGASASGLGGFGPLGQLNPGGAAGYPSAAGVAGQWATATTGITPAPRLAPGEYGPIQPPPEFAIYGNGHVPDHALVPVGDGSHRLWAPAANAFRQLKADAAVEGIHIGITDSYRSHDEQEALAASKGLYSEGGLAATPGHSNHGWGLSLDLDLDEPAQAWMSENGWRYGFVEDVPREPWHWTYRAS